MFIWKKLGKVFKANGQFPWMKSHTTPISAVLLDKSIRIFISTRSAKDSEGNYISYTSFLDVDIINPTKVLYIHDKPIIELGEYGTFDEFGVMVTNVLRIDNLLYLYYAGWQRLGGKTAAYQVMLGLAISDDDGFTFRKVSKGPIIGIDYFDPISIGNVAVIKDDNNWKIYYTSLTEWKIGGKKPTYEYVIKYATSFDGIFWRKTGEIAVGITNNYGVATPTVIKLNDCYHMWFGYRRAYNLDGCVSGYRIGYAFSRDGVKWIRDDKRAGIEVSKSGWDSEMICYPDVIQIDNKLYMFYCGNGFGKDGFGISEIELNDF